jgi:glucose 1-dehydrogenase
MQFHNCSAVVTGGESGIGKACVLALVAEGASVAFSYLRDEVAARAVETAAKASGGDAAAIRTDVGIEADVANLFRGAQDRFGVPTLLINSAGRNMSGTMIGDMTLEQFDGVLRADLYGPFLTCRSFVRVLATVEGKGRIVNISSIHERAPRPGGADYDAAKGGLAQLTATLALELAPKGIAVNGVAPGMILTPMNQGAIDHPDELRAKAAAIPWGRAGQPEEVAGLVLFLLSSKADYITGTTVTIDGALSLTVAQGA